MEQLQPIQLMAGESQLKVTDTAQGKEILITVGKDTVDPIATVQGLMDSLRMATMTVGKEPQPMVAVSVGAGPTGKHIEITLDPRDRDPSGTVAFLMKDFPDLASVRVLTEAAAKAEQDYVAYPYEKQLETILGVDRAEAYYALRGNIQGVIKYNVCQFMYDVRWDLVSRTRKKMEAANNELHFIPYGTVTQFALDKLHVAIYNRPAKNNGESRLAGKASIGFAGHVDIIDYVRDSKGVLNGYDTAMRCFLREMSEELKYFINGERFSLLDRPDLYSVEVLGLIHDRTDAVGQSHLGIYFNLKLHPDVTIESNEDQILNVAWLPADKLLTEDRNFENWSQMLAEEIGLNQRYDTWTPITLPVGLDTDLSMEEFTEKYTSNTFQPGWVEFEMDGAKQWRHPALVEALDRQYTKPADEAPASN